MAPSRSSCPSCPAWRPDLLTHGNDDQLTFISPLDQYERTECDVNIRVMADTNTRALSGVDPARQSLLQGSRRELFNTYLQRASDGQLDWTLTLFPTDGLRAGRRDVDRGFH